MATTLPQSEGASAVHPGLNPLWSQLGAERSAPGNAPVALGDGDAIWCVLEGKLDVFAVRASDGRPAARTFLWEAVAGNAVAGGSATGASSLRLVAVGGTSTKLLELRREALDDPGSGAERAEVAALLESAMAGLAAGVAAQAQPRIHQELAPGIVLQLEPGARAGAATCCWVRVLEGSVTYGDQRELVLTPASLPLPLAPGQWVGAQSLARLEACTTSEILESGLAWDALQEGVSRFVQWADAQLQAQAGAEIDRLAARTSTDAKVFEGGLRSLARVLDDQPATDAPATVADPLLAACMIIGEHAGLTFRSPPQWEAETRLRDRVGSICRASRIRYREVALRGQWWREASGPLLAFLEDSGEAVALLPSRPGAYQLVMPGTGTATAVSEEVARQLRPFAYVFYRPAPERPLEGRDLIALALHGIRHDVRRVLLLAFASGLLSLGVPLATSRFFTAVIPESQATDVWVLLGSLLAVTAGIACFDLTRAFLLIRVQSRSTDALQAAVVDRLLSLPAPFFRDYAVGDLARRAASINQVRSMVSGVATQSILGSAVGAMNLLLLFHFHRQLALVALVLLVAAAAFTYFFGRRTLSLERQRQELQGRIAGLVFQIVGGIAKLRVAAAERRAFAIWAGLFSTQQRIDFRAGQYQAAITTLNASMPILSTMALFAVTGRIEQSTHPISPGVFIAFMAAFGAFFASGTQLSNTLVSLMSVGPILERARPILTTPPEVDALKPDPGELTGRIEGCQLTFRYRPDGPRILDDVSFQLAPGEFVAFVGPSGSGKSTILRLLLGFERAEGGKIYYDHQALDQLDITAVRAQIGAVLQSSQIMAGSIYKNIIGTAQLTVDEAWEAAAAAGLADDIRDMPMRMNTVLSEGASTLSGGQRQRLLIARALARKPRIMFFDEATSALDNRTQQLVSRSLETTRATRLVIAHRLSTIRHADRIYVINAGRVLQQGSFDELVAAQGMFRQLVARQIA